MYCTPTAKRFVSYQTGEAPEYLCSQIAHFGEKICRYPVWEIYIFNYITVCSQIAIVEEKGVTVAVFAK